MQKNNRKKCKIIDTSIEIIDGDRGKHYPKNNELLPHGFCLFLNTKNLPGSVFDFSSTQFISQEKDSALRKGKLQNNDIVFTTRGTLGHLAWFKDNILYKNVRINSGMVILRNKDNLIDTKFLFLQLASSFVRKQIASLSTGSAQPQLPIKDFLNLEIYLPPIEEQKRIADILGAFDDKIELLQKQNTTLENMAKALFKSWFVDFDVVHAKQQGQPKAAIMQQYHLTEELYNLFPSSFEPSALGPIPTGWQVNPLENLARLIMGQSPAGTSYNEKGEGLPFYQGSTDFSFRFPKKRVYCTAPTRIAEKGDILISVRAPVGDLNIATEKTCIGRGLAALHPTNSMYSFLYYSLLNAKKRLSVFNTEGTVFGSINRKDLSSLLLLNPSKEMMQSFNTLVLPFDIKIESNHKQIQTLTEMRDALLPRLISGKIRV